MSRAKASTTYSPTSYISNILWHFKGAGHDHNIVLKWIEDCITDDSKGGELRPFEATKPYSRELSFGKVVKQGGMTTNPYFVKERKAVCLCDIPISHLPLHMRKYGEIGLGFRKDSLIKAAQDLQPVRYYNIRDEEHFKSEPEKLWKIIEREVNLGDFIKIPTCYEEQDELDQGGNSELFESIYEEREWRSIEGFKFSLNELAFIIIPKKELVTDSFPKLKNLISNVSVIYADDLYERQELI